MPFHSTDIYVTTACICKKENFSRSKAVRSRGLGILQPADDKLNLTIRLSTELTKCHFQSIESTISINSAWTYFDTTRSLFKKNCGNGILAFLAKFWLFQVAIRLSTELTKCQFQSIESTVSINSAWTYLDTGSKF